MSVGNELRIAVVDDAEQERIRIMEEADAILSRESIPHSIELFPDGIKLLDAIRCGRTYDLLLLDVVMEEMDGLSLVAELRKREDHTAVVFISSNQELARKGYRVNASRYLLKPLDPEELEEALMHCYAQLKSQKEILLPTAQGQYRTSFLNIQFAEAFDRGTRFVLSDEIVDTKLKFAEVEAMLPKVGFIRCHRAYIVNAAHTRRIRQYAFEMKSGAVVPISRPRYSEVNRQFVEYLSR